jgi:glycosyltransferase involved in cell wall biosynthesis
LSTKCKLIFIDEHIKPTASKLGEDVASKIVFYKVPLWSKAILSTIPIFRLLLNIKPDLLVINNYGILVKHIIVLLLLKILFKVDIMVVNHSTILSFTKRRKLLEFFGSICFFFVSDIVYVSDYTKRCWEKCYPWLVLLNSRVVHNGVFIPPFSQINIKSRDVVKIGFVGRINDEKNVFLFCHTAWLSHHRKLPFMFVAFGSGDSNKYRKHKYGMAVKWLGEAPNAYSIYSCIDILLLTSPVENCPFSALESKSYGIPTVALNVGGLSEIIKSKYDGILVDKPQDLINGIISICCNYSMYSLECIRNRYLYDINWVGKLLFDRYI